MRTATLTCKTLSKDDLTVAKVGVNPLPWVARAPTVSI